MSKCFQKTLEAFAFRENMQKYIFKEKNVSIIDDEAKRYLHKNNVSQII